MLLFLLQTPTPTPAPTVLSPQNPLVNLLATPQWNGIAAIVAIIGLLIAGISFWKQSQTKRLSYDIISDTELKFFKSSSSLPDIRLTYGDTEITTLRTVTMEFINSGNATIRSEDYDPLSPLTLNINKGALILKCEIISAQTESLRKAIQPTISDCKIVFPPCVMNCKDWFRVEIIFADKYFSTASLPVPTARIAGVDDIKRGQGARKTWKHPSDIRIVIWFTVIFWLTIRIIYLIFGVPINSYSSVLLSLAIAYLVEWIVSSALDPFQIF